MMTVAREKIIDILGEELYHICYCFFLELYRRDCDFKIIMTRRCSSLFKIFSSILRDDGFCNIHGKIITDQTLDLNIDEIRTALKNDSNNKIKVTVFDDIIIYGRTVNFLLDLLEGLSDIEKTKCIEDKILVRCFAKNTSLSQVKERYSKLILSEMHCPGLEWKQISSKFSKLIKAVDIPNTSFIVSYSSTYNVIDALEQLDDLLISNNTEELEELDVFSYVILGEIKASCECLTEKIESCSIRLLYYKSLQTMMVSPLVILKELNHDEMRSICEYVCDKLKLCNNSPIRNLLLEDNSLYYSVRIRLLLLLLSHSLLLVFLKEKIGVYNKNSFDYKDIIALNFNIPICDEFEKISEDDFVEIMSLKFIENFCVEKDEEFEKFLFCQAMRDNQAAALNAQERLDGFNTINNKTIFSNKTMIKVLSMIDNGKAALRAFFKQGKYVSYVYPGEQAFRIMEEKFKMHLPALHSLEKYSIMCGLSSYDLFEEFIRYLLDNKSIENKDAVLLCEYIEILRNTNQQISDVYLYDRDCCEDALYKEYLDFIKRK